MPLRRRIALWMVLAGALLLPGSLAAQTESSTVPSIELSGSIDPATEKWVGSALEDAAGEGAPLAIVRLDTPGGLDTSMREIVQDVIDAPMPVVVYVSPGGARAASAGVFITQAADVAAMAPQTNIGSASPVSLTGADIDTVLGEKIENDAAAYARALADAHGRNGELAATTVTEAENFTADEALAEELIDIVAASEEELLAELDGFRVIGPKATTLDTAGLVIDERDTPFQYEALALLVNPSIAFLLLLVGLVGIAIELFSPGLIVPGTLGLISLVLGAYGTAQLPVTAAGIALLVIGIALIIAEAHLPTSGIVGALGVGALAVSGLLLFDTDSEFDASAPIVIGAALVIGGFLAFAVNRVVAAHRNPALTGWEELIGAGGDVRVPLAPAGQVFVAGALWKATPVDDLSEAEARGLSERGARVRVEAVEGLTLRVRPAGAPDRNETTTAEGAST